VGKLKPSSFNLIEKLESFGKPYFNLADLEKILGLERRSLYVTLSRLTKAGVLRRLRRGVYELSLRPTDIEKVANQIYYPSYLSFEAALARYGIIAQIPYVLTFATAKRSKKLSIRQTVVEYRQLKKELFFGYRLLSEVLVAEPEKALLDQLYLLSLGKAVLHLDELDLRKLSKKKFLAFAKTYPVKVRNKAQMLAKDFGKTIVTIR
jgi:predicted transcriptional regulator of viral defense system